MTAVDTHAPSTAGEANATELSRRRTRRSIGRSLALAWLLLIGGVALLADLLPTPDPKVSTNAISARPLGTFLLGTDQLGRDIFARIAYGARLSTVVAFVSTGCAAAIGIALGSIAGYYRGRMGVIIAGIADIGLALPGLVLLLVLSSVRGASASVLVFGLAFLLTPTFIRLGRANTMVFTQRDFVLASRALGARSSRTLIREVLPNVLPIVGTYGLTAAAHVYVVEGTLSFLGLGIPPPNPTWGSMIASGQIAMRAAPHIVLIPCIVLFLTVLSLNVLGDRK